MLDAELFDVEFEEQEQSFSADFSDVTVIDVGTPYEGEYSVTPSTSVQTLSTKGKRMTEDVTITPIPERYGLITYDHNRVITVT